MDGVFDAGREELQREMQERERAEAALHESDEIFRVIADDPSTIIGLYDAAGRRVFVSPSARQILGDLPADPFDGVHPADLDAAHDAWQRLLSGERTSFTFRYRRSDGAWRWLEAWSSRVPYRGAPHVLTIIRDVSDRVRAQEQVEAREARFRALVERNDALISIVDEGPGRYLYVSPSYTRVLGYRLEELYAMDDVFTLAHPDDVAEVEETWARAADAQSATLARPVRLRAKDGRYRTLTATVTDRRSDPAIGGYVVNARDVTDELLLEEQLRQAQKMEAIGQLAGGIAHDFNNLLSAIIGGAELARLEVPDGSQGARDLDDVRAAAARATQLTRQLLSFSRQQLQRPRVLDLRDLVLGAEKLLRRLIPGEVVLEVAVSECACVVHADPGQLEQVLLNLVVNARDAVDERSAHAAAEPGVVTVTTACWPLGVGDPRLARVGTPPLPPGDYAALVVRDNGVGMDAATRTRVFEPFFTTKAKGKGTGLGLSTVYGVVAQSGGTVLVDSALGSGAAFTVLLPVTHAPLDAIDVAPKAPPGGTETILLVEDERTVRETAARILERHGYRVVPARHGGDAMLAWRERGMTIDALVTDVRMPEIDGPSLIACLRAECPTFPVVVMSGYARGDNEVTAALTAREVFLEKPFTTESLLTQVRAALDGRTPIR